MNTSNRLKKINTWVECPPLDPNTFYLMRKWPKPSSGARPPQCSRMVNLLNCNPVAHVLFRGKGGKKVGAVIFC